MKNFIIVLSTSLFSNSFAQNAPVNLVPNPSFEMKSNIPGKGGVLLIKDWMGANANFGDYYYKSNLDKSSNVPENMFGTQEPHSGNAYTGICLETTFLEYIETNLVSPLIKGQQYVIEIYISRAEKSKSTIEEFGLLFLAEQKTHFLVAGITTEPHVTFGNPKGFKDKEAWTKLSAIYEAQGFEKSLVFGYFTNKPPYKFSGKAHYYIDDFSITPFEVTQKDSSDIDSPVTISPFVGDTLLIGEINFKSGSSSLIGDHSKVTSVVIERMNKYPELKVSIEGHTDNSGKDDINQSLSHDRAKAVFDYLTANGIEPSRINFKGMGSSFPVADNKTPLGKSKNRRVEIIFK